MRKAPILFFVENSAELPERIRQRCRKSTRRKSVGPDGKPGTLIAPFADVLVEYEPDSQRWQQVAGVWVGIAEQVQSADFLRSFTVPGYGVKLGDRREWIIPVATLAMPNFSLPTRDVLDGSGNWRQEIDERYKLIAELADEIFNDIYEPDQLSFAEERIREVCLAAIRVNYDISDVEVSALGLLTSAAYQRIIEAIIDRPALLAMKAAEAAQKKTADTSGTCSGGRGLTPDTSPRGRI